MSPRIPLLLALIACGDPGGDTAPTTGTPTGTSADGLALSLEQSERAKAVWYASWTQDQPGTAWVEYGLTPDLGLATPISPEGTSHDIALLGLKAAHTYYVQAVTSLADGTELRSEVLEQDTDPLPDGIGRPTLIQADAGSALGEGYLLFSQVQTDGGTTSVVIVDGEGDPVWWRLGRPGTMIVTSRIASNGRDVHYAEWDFAAPDDVGTLFRVGLDGREVTETLLDRGHHDFHEWPDGTLGFVGFEEDPVGGWVSDAILESPEGTTVRGQTTRVWSWFDDYPAAPSVLCDHVSAGWQPDPSLDEWTHSNSMMVHPDGEHYLLMSKFHDTLLKIRRDTGELVWQLNGRYGDFTVNGSDPWTALGESELFSHAHMSHAYAAPAGSGHDLCLAVFDNGEHRLPEASRAVEICLDEVALTADITWAHDEPSGGFTNLMGDVRRLDQGWLVGWSGLRRIEELGDDGTVHWGLELVENAFAGRVRYVPSLYPAE